MATEEFHHRRHARALAIVCNVLFTWLLFRPLPRGEVLGGDAAFRLPGPGDTTTVVGIDIAYVAPEVLARQATDAVVITGVPVLAVEIVSPSSRVEDIDTKIRLYLTAGVKVVWILDPGWRTVTVYRPGVDPELVTAGQTLTAPELPGFAATGASLFG